MAYTFDGKTFLGAAFNAPVGAERLAEILRLAVTAGVAETAAVAQFTDELSGEPETPHYFGAEDVLRSDDRHRWHDVLIKHVPAEWAFSALESRPEGEWAERDAHVCGDCTWDVAIAAIRNGSATEPFVFFQPNRQDEENQLLSRFDEEFTQMRCDVCGDTYI